ncbi:hypothetical protein L6164_030000 [Bauhinia variegata]|uniref:Uncharacterized protein n=1 Tax=Bauhinia variegata TaxID=167791 RepID=A0ACB9LBE2_BAUVA|nr:hypothetical protein L6164_030000 [Bauhinia variegata]
MGTAARTNCLTSLAIVLMVAGTLIVRSSSLPVNGNCRGSTPTLISDCKNFVQKGGQQTTPSADCCHVVKAVGAGCLCSLLSGPAANAIDINKAVFVVRSCGLTLQPGSKCGGTLNY